MAIQFFDCKGFGQLEMSQSWAYRAGQVEAQCKLDPEKFAAHFPMTPAEASDNKIYAEVGAFLISSTSYFVGFGVVPLKE